MTLPYGIYISRVEGAAGPDRELDRDIWEAVTNECTHRETQFVYLENDERELECVNCGADTYGADKWSGLTASLDAALALMGRVLPGCWWDIEREFVYDKGELRERYVGRLRVARDAYLHVTTALTPALAILAAMLKALARQVETKVAELRRNCDDLG